jgi:hypothetical protein
MTLCECGCGQPIKEGNRFMHGHHARLLEIRKKISIANTGKRHKGLSGDLNPSKRPEVRAKISATLTGRHLTEETKRKLSFAFSGDKNPSKRLDVRKKISEGLIGRPVTEHQRQSQSKAMKKWYADPNSKKTIEEMNRYHSWILTDWDFYNKHGVTKTRYPYNNCFTEEFKEKIRKRDNYTCQVTGMTNEEHIKKYGKQLHVHHWNYNKNETNPFYFVSVTHDINSMANSKKDRMKWIDMFNGIMEDKYCEMLKEENKNGS